MALNVFSNNGEGSLLSAIGTGDVVLSLEAGEGATMPAITTGQQFPLAVVEGSTFEWMICTARAGDQLTVTRDPTSPQSFTAAAIVHHRMNADALNQFKQKGSERSVAVTPNGSLAALYFGEEVLLTTTGRWFKHTTGVVWQEMNYNPGQ